MSITQALTGNSPVSNSNNNGVSPEELDFEKGRLRLEVDQEPFNSTLKTKTTTTKKLGVEINRMLKPILSDYAGCVFKTENGMLKMDLYFTDRGQASNDSVKCITQLSDFNKSKDSATSSVTSRISAFNNRSNAQKLTLTEEAREVLTDLLPGYKMRACDRKQFWNNNIIECTERASFGSGVNVYLQICNLDITKFLKLKYGKKEDKSYVDYAIQLIRPVAEVVNYNPLNQTNANFLISISQLNTDEVKELCNEIGMVSTMNEIPMIRA